MTIPAGRHTHHKILVVDDDERILESLGTILRHDGHEVITATDAARAIEAISDCVPCLALVDVMLPGMDGFELCRLIKHNPRTAHVPVALITGLVEETDVEQGITAGAVDYIRKPFDRAEIRMRVRTQITLHEALLKHQRDERRLALITDAARDAIILMDNTGAIALWNPAATAMFGYSPEEAIGKSVHELLAPGQFLAQHQAAFPDFQHTGTGNLVGKTFELCAVRKGGRGLLIELSLSAVEIDGAWCALGIARDITERKSRDEYYRILFESSRDALMTLAPPDWRFTTGNAAAIEMFAARELADFVTRPPWEYSPERQPDDRLSSDKAREMIETALREGSHFFEWTHRRLGGPDFPATVLLTRVESGGQTQLQATVRDITEVKRVEDALRRSEAQFRALVDNVSVGVALISPAMEVLMVNKLMRAWFPHVDESRLPLCYRVFNDPPRDGKCIHCPTGLTLQDGLVHEATTETQTGDKFTYCRIVASPVKDNSGKVVAAIKMVEDVTERTCAERALRASEARLTAILAEVPVGIVMIGRDRRIHWANQAALYMAGLESWNQLEGQLCHEYLCPRQPGECPILDLGQTISRAERVLRQHDGLEVPIIKSVHEIDFEGERVLLETYVDLSERRRLEAELSHALKLEAVGQLAAGVAHELNNPIGFIASNFNSLQKYFNALKEYIDRLVTFSEQTAGDSASAPMYQDILDFRKKRKIDFMLTDIDSIFEESLKGVDRVTTIVKSLRNFSRIDFDGKMGPFDLNGGIQDTLVVAWNEIKYAADVKKELGALTPIEGYGSELNQVFLNILVNAAQAIKGQNRKEKGLITVRTSQDGHWAVVEISDDGPGIPTNIIHRVFDPFFTTKVVGKGTGLGLSISYDIVVNKHKGELLVESEAGKGARFIIRLPVKRPQHP